MDNNRTITIEELQLISNTLSCVHNFISNEIDVICDEDYRQEVETILEEITNCITKVNNYLY